MKEQRIQLRHVGVLTALAAGTLLALGTSGGTSGDSTGKNLRSGLWDAAFDLGRTETLEDRLKRASNAVDALRARQAVGRSALPAFSSAPPLRPEDVAGEDARTANRLASATEQQLELARRVLRQQDSAFADADRADGGAPRESAVNEEVIKKAHASAGTLTRVPAGHYFGDEYANRQRELNSGPAAPVAATF